METDDPRTWTFDSARKLWLDDYQERFVLLDFRDYLWACRWLWYSKPNKNGKKLYAYRSSTLQRRSFSVFLHIEILQRMEPRPSWAECGDHRNGNSLDCRRENLRWATFRMNRRNLLGAQPHELMEN